jgi:hypothetical protein
MESVNRGGNQEVVSLASSGNVAAQGYLPHIMRDPVFPVAGG